MKILFSAFVLGLALFQAPAFAASASEEAVQAQLAEFQGGCAQAAGEEATVAEAAAGRKCTSSIWCGAFEHCVDGVCKPKGPFNRCDAFHRCSFGERCVNGECKR